METRARDRTARDWTSRALTPLDGPVVADAIQRIFAAPHLEVRCVLQESRPDHPSPDLVSRPVHVQPIGQEDVLSRCSIFTPHRRRNVEEVEERRLFAGRSQEPVRLLDVRPLVPTRAARLHRENEDTALGKCLVDPLVHRVERLQHVLRRGLERAPRGRSSVRRLAPPRR